MSATILSEGPNTGISRHWLEVLEENDVRFISLDPQYDQKMIEVLENREGWTAEFVSEGAVFYVREGFLANPMDELILTIEDEPKIAKLARDYLERGGFRVLTASAGDTGLAMARAEHPDLVILDLMLPGMDGLDVCRALRRESDVPIIMLTARSEEADRLVGLELGADDYISKPFSPRELVARVRALLRRAKGTVYQPGVIRAGDLTIETESHRVMRGSESIHLTRFEFNLLQTMAQHPGQMYSRAQLLEKLHGVAYDGFDRSVDAHIKNLRRKIEDDPANPKYILTVYGVGYKFSAEDPQR